MKGNSSSKAWNWLQRNGCILGRVVRKPKKDMPQKEEEQIQQQQQQQQYNVLMLSGGRARVLDHQWVAFLRQCAFDIVNKLPTYFTEVQTDPATPRRLCSDLDYVMLSAFPDEKIIQSHLLVMQSVVNSFFPEGNNSAVILLSPGKRCSKIVNGVSVLAFKLGVHVIWFHTIVNQEQSLRVRASWLLALETAFGPAENIDQSWSTIVDEAIYSGGLRLPGSAKCKLCPACKNREALVSACADCEGHGRLYEDGTYLPQWLMRTEGALEVDEFVTKKNHHEMLLRSTVRVIDGILRSDYRVPPGAPIAMPSRFTPQLTQKRKRKSAEVNRDLFEDDKIGMSKIRQKEILEMDSPEVIALTDFIHTCMPQIYANAAIRSVWTNKTRSMFWITTKSSYCENVKREHNSNTIYFVASAKDGCMRQLCWSTKLCSGYSSKGVQLSVELIALLFNGQLGGKKGSGGVNMVTGGMMGLSLSSHEINNSIAARRNKTLPQVHFEKTSTAYVVGQVFNNFAHLLAGRVPLRVNSQH